MVQVSALDELNKQIELCRDCELGWQRTKAVPGEGAENADLLFIGEAPGWHEDQLGRPFVGPAGQFLEELLARIGLKRQQVYITNVIKCRPPGNRDPLPKEIETCSKWLDKQVELICPKMVVTLGRYSLARYFSNTVIGKAHGKFQKRGNIIFYAMYHPAAALHQGSLRKIIEQDMLQIPEILAKRDKIKEDETEPQQLSLF